MHRVDTSTTTGSLPASDAQGTPGFFTKGNPATSTPATVPGQDWFNMIQEELVHVVLQAGIPLNTAKNDFTQLYTAIIGLISTSVNTASETVKGIAEIATQDETDAGTDDSRFVTPKKLKNFALQATETVLGRAKIASQTQTNTGSNDATIVTPLKLLFGSAFLLATNGYARFPDWAGRFTVQWGVTAALAQNSSITFFFPIPFPTNTFMILGGHRGAAVPTLTDTAINSDFVSNSQGMVLKGANGGSAPRSAPVWWIAIGN